MSHAVPDAADAVAEGIRLHNRGLHLEAHHQLEEAWRVAVGSRRRILRGLIQLTAAGVHLERRRIRPAVLLLDRALVNLETGTASGPAAGSDAIPVDLDRLARETVILRRRLTGGDTGPESPSPALLPRMHPSAVSPAGGRSRA